MDGVSFSDSKDTANAPLGMLVVDDEPLICGLIGQIAKSFGFEFAAASSLGEFRRAVAARRPQLVVVDLMLPDGDGLEALQELARIEPRPQVLLVSGFDQRVLDSARRFATMHGLKVVGALSKPFGAKEVTAALRGAGGLSPAPTVEELRHAVERGDISLKYQPIVDLTTGAVAGVEALARWTLNSWSVAPDVFIPLAEEAALMEQLTRHVLKKALDDCAAWKRAGLTLRVAVNVSAEGLRNPQLAREVQELLQIRGLSGGDLEIEVTERQALADPMQMTAVLTRLRLLGVEIAMDDFGTGHAYLTELRRLPFSRIKVDRSFVADCATDRDAEAITRAIVSLGHNLGLKVTAEGVEGAAAWRALAGFGCDAAQGYFISVPVAAAALRSTIDDWHVTYHRAREAGAIGARRPVSRVAAC